MRVNGRLQNRLYHKDSCPEHIVLADSINGTQFNHFQSSPHDHDISFAEFNTECDNSYIPSSIHSYNDFTTSDIHITSSNFHDSHSPLHDPSNSPISSISDSTHSSHSPVHNSHNTSPSSNDSTHSSHSPVDNSHNTSPSSNTYTSHKRSRLPCNYAPQSPSCLSPVYKKVNMTTTPNRL